MTLLHTRHAPASLGCNEGLHCHSCNLDEPAVGYISCPECFHVYRTGAALWRAYMGQHLRLWRKDVRHPLIPPTGIPGVRWVDLHLPRLVSTWILLRSVFTRPAEITFCQECTHDF